MNRTEPNLETEAIWREFHERLRAFISRRVPSPADVDDILQEVFVRIHRHVDSLQNRERLAAWLFQVTRNAIIEHFRGHKIHAEPQTDEIDPPAPKNQDDGSEAIELSRCIEPMIAALPETYREAIQSTDINGLTQVEAAQRKGVSVSGMKSRVQRARRQLKDMLLNCCRVELDRRGGIRDYQVRDVSNSPCGSCGREEMAVAPHFVPSGRRQLRQPHVPPPATARGSRNQNEPLCQVKTSGAPIKPSVR